MGILKSVSGKVLALEAARIIGQLLSSGVISREALRNYDAMVSEDLHSWLQYALMKAADNLGLLAIPEVRVPFYRPLKPDEVLPGRKGKRRWLKRVDIGFFSPAKKFLGFGECHTLDEFHGCLATEELVKLVHELAGREIYDVEKMWISPRDMIIHMVRYAREDRRPEIAVLLVVLPERLGKRCARFEDQKALLKMGSSFFLKRWAEFVEEMRKEKVDAHLVRLGENGVWVDGELIIDLSSEALKERVERWGRLASSMEITLFTEEGEEGWKWMSREYVERKLGLR